MFETHIYGSPIRSDFQLMDTRHPMAPLRPNMQPLRLQRVQAGQQLGDFCIDYRIPQSHGRRITAHSDREIPRLEDGQPWCLRIDDILSFYFRVGEDYIYYSGTEQATEKVIGFWFVHVILPYLLTLERDYSFLHASAVNLDSESLVFMAESHGGKSTLAGHFLARGHKLISDDKVAVFKQDEQYLTVPSHPYFRPYRQDEELGHHSDTFAASAKPLRAIYLLERSADNEIRLEPVRGAEALGNIMASCLSLFPKFWIDRMDFLGDLAHSVPMFRLHRPWGMEHMDAVHHALTSGVALKD